MKKIEAARELHAIYNSYEVRKVKLATILRKMYKWGRSKNMFFSMLAEEDFTNKEVVLVHLILITFLTCTAFVETYPVISILAVIVGAVCVKFLNNVGNKNSNVTN